MNPGRAAARRVLAKITIACAVFMMLLGLLLLDWPLVFMGAVFAALGLWIRQSADKWDGGAG